MSKARREEIQEKVEGLIRGEEDVRIQMWILGRIGGWRMVDISKRYNYTDGSGVFHVLKRLEMSDDKKVMKTRINNLSSFKS